MKKLLMVLAFAGVSVASMAQEAVPTEKYSVSTNSFWSNWFVQANAVGTSFWGSQENQAFKFDKLFKGYRTNLGFSVAVGKWFTPGIGLRTKFTGIWGRSVISEDKSTNANKYWVVNEQVLFNLSNLLCGYNEGRVWNFVPYVGAGVGRNMSYNTYAMNLNAGILNMFRISKKVAINLDINYGLFEPRFDGFPAHGTSKHSFKNMDRTINVEVGLTYNLGKATWNKTPDVEAIKALSQGQIDALNAQLADANAENARLNNIIKNHKCPEVKDGGEKVVEKVISTPVSVFFNIGKSKIASQKDLVAVKTIAEAAKANNAKIVVKGYADSKTGKADFNQKLSQKRAEAVAAELVKLGVDKANIECQAEGGVNTLSPISFNRRATVELK
jgi:outer membrane protein OmpA-like peptidoglycan-associated protein